MRSSLILFAAALLGVASCQEKMSSPQANPKVSPEPKAAVEKEEKKVSPLPPEVKVKLKRDGKENYSWELSGSDVDQVLKVDETLKKRLGDEQNRQKK